MKLILKNLLLYEILSEFYEVYCVKINGKVLPLYFMGKYIVF